MISPPLDSTHGRMMSGAACHHRLWAAQTVERRRVWHDITALGLHVRSDDVGHGMTSLPLDSTHGRTTSGVARHYRPWTARTVERRPAWHSIIAYGQQTRSNDVGRGMTSPPLDSTHDRTKLGMTCHHRPCTARTVGRRQAWYAITALEKHTRSNNVGHGLTALS